MDARPDTQGHFDIRNQHAAIDLCAVSTAQVHDVGPVLIDADAKVMPRDQQAVCGANIIEAQIG